MYAYPIDIHEDDTGIWATSPLMPEFHSAGDDMADLLRQAKDGLDATFSIYMDQRRKIPVPAMPIDNQQGRHGIYLSALTAAKIELWNAMMEQDLTKAQLARMLEISPTQAARLVDVLHTSRIDQVERALSALGKRLVLAVEAV